MKNVKKSVLLSLISLALISCGENTSASDVTTATRPTDKVTNTETAKPIETATPDTTVGPDTTTAPDTDSEPNTDSEPRTDEDAWGEEISTLMSKHLGGVVLPYISLGRNPEGSWARNSGDYGILTVIGSKFNKDLLTTATTAFEAKGWTCTTTATTFTGELKDKHVKVELTSDQYGYAMLTAVYDEPFDATSVDSWDQDTLDSMRDHLGGHTLPFIYTGMAVPFTQWSNTTKTFSIDGGKWDDSVLDLALDSLTKANYTNVKKTTESWGVVVSGDFTFDDGCSVSVSLYKSGAETVPFPYLSVFYKEAYNPVEGATWPSVISNRFNDSFDGHQLPYLYLGSDELSSDWNSTVTKLTISGGAFDTRMFASAKATLTADGYDCTDEMDSKGAQKSLIASKKMSDGCTMVAVLFGNSKLAKLDVYYYSPLSIPADATEFDEVVKAKMDKYLDGHSAEVPFVYLGTDVLDVSFDDYDDALEIVGDKFNGAMIDNAKKSFADAGYTISLASDESYGRVFTATKTLSDKCVITAKMASSYGTKTAVLSLSCVEGYNPPSAGSAEAAWSETIKGAMTLELGGHVLPYFYLGTKAAALKQSKNTIELVGGSYNSEILTSTKEALKTMEGFTWTFTDGVDRIDGTGVDKDGNKITIALYKNSKNKAYFKATYLKAFVVPTNGAWSEAVQSAMTTNFGEVLPFVYLATDAPDAGEFYDGRLDIKGGTWDDQMYDLAEKAFKASGFTLSTGTSENDSGEMITAYKESNGKLIRLAVYNSSDVAMYRACVDEAPTYPTDQTDWSSAIKTAIEGYMGTTNTIPYFYTGDSTPSTRQRTWSGNGKIYLQISSLKNWNQNYTLNAKKVLETAGWTTTFYAVQGDISSAAGAKLVAKNTYSDGSSVVLTIKAGYSNTIYIAYQKPFAPSLETSWAPTVLNAMESNLNGHVIPYFYMGTDEPTFAFDRTTHCLQVVGSVWNEEIYGLAEKALKADTSLEWNILYDYSVGQYSSGKTLLAVAEEKDTGKHLTVKIYNFTSGTNEYGVQAPVMEVYYN